MRLIDADACESYFWEHLDDNGMAAAMNAINDMPTIEPKIVRCKNCEYNSNTCGNYVNCDIIPQMFGRTADNFCSMAEMRTDGTCID